VRPDGEVSRRKHRWEERHVAARKLGGGPGHRTVPGND
jgi:hypothetical protein